MIYGVPEDKNAWSEKLKSYNWKTNSSLVIVVTSTSDDTAMGEVSSTGLLLVPYVPE